MKSSSQSPIAIIGMAGRFPDAADTGEFWRNLEQGRESLVSLADADLLKAGVDASLLENPHYVKKHSAFEDTFLFDAGFFGFTPREAELMDPQHRLFLEWAWHALEDAGYSADSVRGTVGVYAGTGMNTYVFSNLLQNPEAIQAAGGYQLMLGNDKDFLSTRVSYKLNLKGPSLTVQTACSTSLVAVQVACQALSARQCDTALAGGISLHFPQNTGYLYEEGMIFSVDGRCRPFDANASGIRAGQGGGIVVLKRLDDALHDGDTIRAVILGAAVNNDGAAKMGYTAPGVEGQATAIASAHRQAGIDPSTITYVEAHGTGTRVGDPIEFSALERVFRASTDRKQFCAIGSVKSNIGHLDTAAGVAGLIKTVMALQHKQIPASLGFETPNPLIDFANSPFYVNTKLAYWESETPRRAGISSFGIGGTNAHLVLEEAPVQRESATKWPAQVLVLSAKSASALEKVSQNLGSYFLENPAASWPDACYTLQVGRKSLPHRRAIVCATREEAIQALHSSSREGGVVAADRGNRAVTFMFSGQGSQHPGMARGLYETEPVFRKCFDVCADLLKAGLGGDLRESVYGNSANAAALNQTHLAQAALFAVEYSLARMWMSWGVEPDSLIGHSIGEYTAACLAGVFSLEDTLKLVEARGRIMQSMPSGGMLAVALPPEQLRNVLNSDLSLAAVNAPSLCTVAGPEAAIQALRARLEISGVESTRLHTSHAFHSSLMNDAIEPFLEHFRGVKLNTPHIPLMSNVTGEWIRPQDAINPSYWANHLRQTVRFSDGIRQLSSTAGRIFLEIGPSQALSTFARQAVRGAKDAEVFSSLPQAKEAQKDSQTDLPFILNTVAKLWRAGAAIDWDGLHAGENLHRIPLPVYPFERQRHFVQPQGNAAPLSSKTESPELNRKKLDDWFYVPSWSRSIAPSTVVQQENRGPWLIFKNFNGALQAQLATSVAEKLTARGDTFITVDPGKQFQVLGNRAYAIRPDHAEDYVRLLKELRSAGHAPRSILYLWGLPDLPNAGRTGFHSLLHLAQAFGEGISSGQVDCLIVSAGLHSVTGREAIDPEQALLLGPAKVIPCEYPELVCRNIDLEQPFPSSDALANLAANLLLEPLMPESVGPVAYRDGHRWLQEYLPVRLPAPKDQVLRERGTYLITGGTGGIGLTLAGHLAENFHARLALTSRTPVPARGEWTHWLDTHPTADRVSVVLRAAQKLEALGAEVLLLNADAVDANAMAQAVAEVRNRYGKIHGVIHAAGIAIGGLIQLKTRESAERVLAPKVDGTRILHSLIAADEPDFFVLCSSINALQGVGGAVDYCAANAFLDSFAASQEGAKGITVSLNWDTWQEVGMAANTVVPADMAQAWNKKLSSGITPAEGVEAFLRALQARVPQVAIITNDLNQMAEFAMLHRAVSRSAADRTEAQVHAATATTELNPAEPTGDAQQKVTAIWRELLGIDNIGPDNNFFELGGHSLLATRVLSRVRNTFGLAIPLQTIFDAPTVRQFADHIETLLWATNQPTASDSELREEVEL